MDNEILIDMAREQRTFFILQREREMNLHSRGRRNAAIGAGMCILGASAASLFSGIDLTTAVQTQLDAIYSWEALGEHFKNIGPLSTMLIVGAAGFISKYMGHNKQFRNAREQLVDLNTSMLFNAEIRPNEIGENENARTR